MASAWLPTLVVVAVCTWGWLRLRLAHDEEASRRVFALSFPRELKAGQLVSLLRGVTGLKPSWWRRLLGTPAIVLETRATRKGISHLLSVPERYAEFVTAQLWATVPGIAIAEAPDAGEAAYTDARELRLSRADRPLRSDQPEAVAAGTLAALQPLAADEQLLVQWVISPGAAIHRGWGSLLRDLIFGPEQRSSDSYQRREQQRKHAEPLFGAACRVAVQAADPSRSKRLLGRVLGSFHAPAAPGVTLRRRFVPSAVTVQRAAKAAVPAFAYPCLLNAAELAGLLGIPIDGPQLPGLNLAGTRQLAPSPLIPTEGRVLGRSTFPGVERRLAMSNEASLRPLHCLGPTGSGKSTLLLNCIVQDLQAKERHGVAVIDPKSDLVSDVLDRIPPGRERDVIVIDPSDSEQPVGVNLLGDGNAPPELIADQVVGMFHQMHRANWGPRSDDVLRAAITTLCHEPGNTLCQVPVLLTSATFRRELVAKVDDPVALNPFWSWFEGISEAERGQVIAPVMNKLRQVFLRTRLRNVVGQAKPTFSFTEAIAEGKVILCPLGKGALGEEAAALLGSIVMAMLWHAIQGRAALPQEKRRPFYLYCDEFQDFVEAPTAFSDVLTQARGYGLGLTVSHQHLFQLPPALRHATLANARSRVAFQTSATDASLLAREFGGSVSPDDLKALGRYQALLAVSTGAEVLPPCTMVTEPPPEKVGRGWGVRELSRARYGRKREQIEAEIKARSGVGSNEGEIGTRRRQP